MTTGRWGKQHLTKGWFSKRVVLADVLPERKLGRGYIRMFPRNETGTRVRSHVPPEQKPERGYICQNHPFTKRPFVNEVMNLNRLHSYEQKQVDLATFRAVPASTWGQCAQVLFYTIAWDTAGKEKLPNGLLQPPPKPPTII